MVASSRLKSAVDQASAGPGDELDDWLKTEPELKASHYTSPFAFILE